MSSIISPAFFAGSPGPMELIVIFLLILVLFGPRRLPEIAKMIGKTIHELRKASEDFKDQVMSIETDPVEQASPVEPDSTDPTDRSDMSDSSDPYDQSDYDDMSDYDECDGELAEDVLSDSDVDVADTEVDVAEEDSKEQAV